MIQFIYMYPNLPKTSVPFFTALCMPPHVNYVCISAFYHLHNISCIRTFLFSKTTEILVHAFVPLRLDYRKKLQSVQNATTHQITCSREYDLITLVLSDLHWLPINECANSKFFCSLSRLYTNKHPPTFNIW